ncbi:tyrosine-type recombinase/integrase [Spiribacter vilamensis]|uniref:Site-specific recombinase XerC n=1 Tax=Spiribacter vilamensis TaxID=531306 RepID=A0A4Q8D0I4_9GAMM|nr:site-specific integrase [Spiribacter vilamensis]RZU98784.1 site-specific recombinase XerC [Spiribacter vilamensis]TVO62195.1 tyrosine-type recombinase/integrase [Spiribacter vilamensis]
MKFTDGKGGNIARAEPPEKGQRLLFDDHRDAPRGFGLRITGAGGKAFILKYTSEGKQRRKTIGAWPDWSLEAARDEARGIRQQIDSGIDPLEEKRRRRADPTVADAVADYIRKHVTGLVSEKPITRYFERDMVPALGALKVRDVRRRDVLDMIEDKAEQTPTAARHLLAYSKGFFDWCVDREYIDASPAASIKPKNVKAQGRKDALKTRQRRRVLDHDEVAAFWSGAEDCGIHRLTALALKMVLLTGQRPGEVAGMHHDEISGDVWTIPAERRRKTETAHRVPLTPLALEIIDTARNEVARLYERRRGEPSGYVFEARPHAPVSVSALSKAVHRFAEPLGNRDAPTWGHWTPHDLRRTARTEVTACGYPQEIAERVIGHADQGIVAVYNQHQYDHEKRAALEAWERRLLRITSGESADDNVVSIAEART